jgi:guanosine-3',5'-bis(diphosphate) 3'-pyrophosphohydrolase
VEDEEAIGRVLSATAFAAQKHSRQRRKDSEASPYINHPIDLAQTLWEHGVTDPVVLCAALLHDTIEDTDTTHEELVAHFGEQIAGVVDEVTDDKRLGKAERKRLQIVHAARASHEARLVKLADKICNLTDMIGAPPAGWPETRKQEYFDWARAVIDALRGTHERLEATFDAIHARGTKGERP